MRKFFSVWLILLVIIAFAAALFVSYPILTNGARQSAQNDLNVLLDAAFLRISLAETSAETVAKSANDNVLSKARAIDRFLSHDDALLQTDALVVLCELLNVSAIDVTDQDGAITASSVGARIGRNLLDDAKTKWAEEALKGDNLSLTQTDSENSALIAGCVSRTDTGGLIYIQSLDVAIMEAATAATPAQVLLDMSFIKDTLAVAETEGEDGPFLTDDSYNVRRTENGVSLVASRALSQVYAVRSGVSLALVIGFLLCLLFAAVIQTMLIKKRLESRKGTAAAVSADGADAISEFGGEDAPAKDAKDTEIEADSDGTDAPNEALPTETEPSDAEKKPRRKGKKTRQKIFEFVDVEEPAASDASAETTAPPEAPASKADDGSEAAEADKQTKSAKKKPRRHHHGAIPQEETSESKDADGDPAAALVEEALQAPLQQEDSVIAEAAAEFAAPEAVLEESVAEEELEAPAARKRTHRKDVAEEDAPEPPHKPRRKRRHEEPVDADSAFDKIFD